MATIPVPGLKVPFGLKDKKLYSPIEILGVGLACGCFCPGCGTQLIVREGSKRRHFSHFGAPASNHCVESAIHRAAIQVLLEANWIQVPEMTIEATVPTRTGPDHSGSQIMSFARIIRFDTSDSEVHIKISDEIAIRPDVVGYRKGRQLLVEMFFRHAVDEDKRSKLTSLGMPAIEIDLSDFELGEGFDAIRQRVLEDTAYKEWLIYPGENEARSALLMRLTAEAAAFDDHAERIAASRKKRLEDERAARVKRLENHIHRRTEELARKARAQQAYRETSLAEKEERFRIALKLPQEWPRHLNIANTNSNAIDAPLHIWQTSLFQKFIFEKSLEDFTFDMAQAISWVRERFGSPANSTSDLREAVRQFLAYVGGCGFIDRTYNPYGEDFFKILHNELMPPPRVEKRKPVQTTLRIDTGAVFRGNITGRDWVWEKTWPQYGVAMKVATKWLCRNRAEYMEIIRSLYETNVRPMDPRTFAEGRVKNGLSAREIIELLVDAGLAQ